MSKKWAVSRKTINISQATVNALAKLTKKTGETETALFNRAVQELASALSKEKES